MDSSEDNNADDDPMASQTGNADDGDEDYGYNDDGEASNSAIAAAITTTQRAQQERRNSIREIMADESLTPLEKRRNIQFLMDGRRRSSASHVSTGSVGSSNSPGVMATSAMEAAENHQSDNEDNYSHHSSGNQYAYNINYADASMNGTSNTMDSEYYGYGDYSSQQQTQQHSQDQSASVVVNEELLQALDAGGAAGRKQRSSSMPLWSEDTTRAAAPLVAASSNAIWDDPVNISRRMEKSRPPCSHYERNCTIVSPCCGLAFGCRICHDECPVLPMPFAQRPPPPPQRTEAIVSDSSGSTDTASQDRPPKPQERILNWEAVERAKHRHEKRRSMPLNYDEYAIETHHEIDRFAITEIICRLCYTRQSSKT